jgi:hypothetical protein
LAKNLSGRLMLGDRTCRPEANASRVSARQVSRNRRVEESIGKGDPMRIRTDGAKRLFVAMILGLLLLPNSTSASWLSDATGINIDLAKRPGAERRTVESIAAAVDVKLAQNFPEAQQLQASPSQLKKLYATLSGLELPYEIETLAGKVYVASDYHDLGIVRKNLYGRVRVMISFTDVDGGVPPVIRFVSQERRLRSVGWRESQNAEILRLSRELVTKITTGVSS